MRPLVSCIAVIGKNRAIGKDNKLLWHLPKDLRRFKKLTFGHPIILGRITFESILGALGKPLPGRTNIVLSREPYSNAPDGVIVAHSIEEALEKGRTLDEEVFVGGGAEVYRQMLPYADRLYLTRIDDAPEADSFFPDYSEFNRVVQEKKGFDNGLSYTFIVLERAK